ncbi:MAG: PrsW family intramembrane metalloprotease [Bacteroidales bacterium]|nr:PrsW family intramembrane metalloprotease [Bacteroidales bacterium]
MRKSFFIVIISFVLAIWIVNQFVKKPSFNNTKEYLDFVIKEKQNVRLDLLYWNLLNEDSLNIDYHYGFITNFYNNIGISGISEKKVATIYWRYAESTNDEVSDLGFYALGLIASMSRDYNDALIFFSQASNTELKYLNNSIGRVYEDIGDFNQAEEYYAREIKQKGNIEGAYQNLIRLFYTQSRFNDLYNLLKQRQSRKYFPSHLKRQLFLFNYNFLGYFESVLAHTYKNQSLIGFLGALLIMLSWLFYLRRIDIYEPEKWKHIILIFILGIIFSELTFLLGDLNSIFIGFDLNGKVLNDLIYCIVGIGVVEEFVKILPVILILRLTKAVNEPVDYLVYGSVSALGFAFAENLLYFNNYGPEIITGRALTAVVFHMFLTALASYGLMLNKYKAGRGLLSDFTKLFLLAAIIHGLYDFVLINKVFSKFSLLSVVILVFSLSFFNTLISNALSNSEFFDESIQLNKRKLQNYLIYSLSSIFMFQYLAVSIKLGSEAGLESLRNSVISGGYLIIFISANLGTINIKYRKWKPLQIKFPRFTLKSNNNYDNVIGEEFEIEAVSKNRDLERIFPNKGKIIRKETVSENPEWYLFELNNHTELQDFNGRFILIKSKLPDESIKIGQWTEVAVFVFISDEKINQDLKLREDFLFKGWARLR